MPRTESKQGKIIKEGDDEFWLNVQILMMWFIEWERPVKILIIKPEGKGQTRDRKEGIEMDRRQEGE